MEQYIGKTIGQLFVVDELPPHITPNGSRQRILKCKCSCGKIFTTRLSSAKKNLKCTDCLFLENRKDVTGKKYGKLTVVSMADDYVSPAGHRLSRCNCKCECGNSVVVNMSSLVSGKTKSCGCIHNTRGLLRDCPALIRQYDFEKNEAIGLDFSTLTAGTSTKAWWKCDVCGNSWLATIASQNGKIAHGCPYCSGRLVILGKTDLESQFPDVCKEWNYEKNHGLTPRDISSKSSKKVWWKCSEGHEWKATVANRTGNHSGCPKCNLESVNSFCEQAVYYYVKKAFPDAINSYTDLGFELDIFIPSIKTAIEYDGEAWHSDQKRIENDLLKNKQCKENGIELIRIREPRLPEISNCTVFIRKDSTNTSSLNEVIKMLLNYLNTGLESIDVDNETGKILSQLASKKLLNSLAYCSPEIAQEWHPTKNYPLTPDRISNGSRRKVWWLGKCGHEWQSIVSERTFKPRLLENGKIKKPYGCPICSGKRVIDGVNDLKTINPSLAIQWHPTKNGNLSPSMFTASSNKRVWWLCKNGHEWQSSIQHRNSRNSGCPICNREARSPAVICCENNKMFRNAKEAGLAMNIKHPSHIYACCRDKTKTCGGYHWRFLSK